VAAIGTVAVALGGVAAVFIAAAIAEAIAMDEGLE
jgi:hypothetical protein